MMQKGPAHLDKHLLKIKISTLTPMDSEAKQRDPLQTGISSCATSLRCDFPTVVSLF